MREGGYPAHNGSVVQFLQIIKATWEQYKAIKPFDETMGNSVRAPFSINF